ESDEVVRAEILHGVREEMAMKLADVVMRRTDLGSASCPADATPSTAADIMGAELGWDESRKSAEIEATKKIYQPV
ncbi:glycerol-3-phosphate dehydrogenase/oxidase, partial [bacterium]|nr:glycerol-3-phosphate dehydrogenase/oxidase [bacterium]